MRLGEGGGYACKQQDPDEDMAEAPGEVRTEEALVIPRATAFMFAQILALLAQGRGVQIILEEEELSTQHAADVLNEVFPASFR